MIMPREIPVPSRIPTLDVLPSLFVSTAEITNKPQRPWIMLGPRRRRVRLHYL
jgi:hypothetical protein